jgi:F-type H+-transporting ATPase subunit b
MNLSLLFTVAELWASSAPGGEAHAPSATQLLLPAINFLIFLYLIKRFAMPLVRGHLRARRDEIVTALAEADESKRSAEALVRDYRARLARLEEESQRLRGELAAEGEREKAKLLNEAQELAVRISSDADFLAEQEVKLARQELREEIARLAEEAAQKLLRAGLEPADQKRLVEEFLSGVGRQ